MTRGWTHWEIRVIITPHTLKKRRMCQHPEGAVARSALIKDDQSPVSPPVRGPMPECVAGAGVPAAAAIPEERERRGTWKTEEGPSNVPS